MLTYGALKVFVKVAVGKLQQQTRLANLRVSHEEDLENMIQS